MTRHRILLSAIITLAVTGAVADDFLPETGSQNVVAVDATWNRQMQVMFPPGTPVETVIATLTDQGFVIDRQWSHADLHLPGLFCRERFQVVWSGDVQVESIQGTFGLVCL